jgi:predicted DCC family thiol-disulfide oxidoreductase YuxK
VVLLYDDDCGFCVWTVAYLLRRDHARALRPLAIQSAEGAELLGDLDERERLRSWHAVAPDGTRSSGGDAFVPILGVLPRLSAAAALMRRVPPSLRRFGYDLVARNRTPLSRFVPQRSKRRARADLERRLAGEVELHGSRVGEVP